VTSVTVSPVLCVYVCSVALFVHVSARYAFVDTLVRLTASVPVVAGLLAHRLSAGAAIPPEKPIVIAFSGHPAAQQTRSD
jgi:hypothetical protein